jgi:cyclopropane fatty-acyl-phospholipid synthase-like methyltransferase
MLTFKSAHTHTQTALSKAVKDYYNAAQQDRNLIQAGEDGYVHHHYGIGKTEFDYKNATTEQITVEVQRLESNLTEHIVTLLQFDNYKNNESVVDLGCGRGGNLFTILDKKPDVTAKGITIAEYQASFCADKILSKGLSDRAEVVQGSYLETPYQDNEFSHAFCCETTQYTVDLCDLFGEVHRILTPKGRFVIATWCFDDNKDTSRFHEFIDPINDNYGSTMHGINEYLNALDTSGFDVVFTEDFTEDQVNYWDVRDSWELKSGVEPYFLQAHKAKDMLYKFIVATKR